MRMREKLYLIYFDNLKYVTFHYVCRCQHLVSLTLGYIKLRKQRFQDLQKFATSVISPHGSWDTRCEVYPQSKSMPLLQCLLVICNERSY